MAAAKPTARGIAASDEKQGARIAARNPERIKCIIGLCAPLRNRQPVLRTIPQAARWISLFSTQFGEGAGSGKPADVADLFMVVLSHFCSEFRLVDELKEHAFEMRFLVSRGNGATLVSCPVCSRVFRYTGEFLGRGLGSCAEFIR